MAALHILLLPRQNYYEWVSAAQDYAAHFGANLTHDPHTAGRYMAPHQTITVAGAPDGYPAQGDIRQWLRQHYPAVRVDYVPSRTPAELKAALDQRAEHNVRFGHAAGTFALRWPTDYPVIVQPFGANPEVYRRWGWPGHAGLDIFAVPGTDVRACATGTVAPVSGALAAEGSGQAIGLQHEDGYQTVYANLGEVRVQRGQRVAAGTVIGRAGAAGNYVHLSLIKAGASAGGETTFPDDLIDPAPLLEQPGSGAAPTMPTYPWPPGHCLAGVHGRADGRLQPADYPALTAARMEAVKLLTTASGEDVDGLRAFNSRIFILVRLFASFDNRTVRPDEFVSWLAPEMAPFYQRGLRYFEVHNEPNLMPEGWTTSWNDGREFGNWFLDVRARLKQQFPQALLGYPGLSPGGGIPGLRMAALDFLTGSDAACRAADWVGVHCYWQSEQELNSVAGGLGYLDYRLRFPEKVLFITEFSNVSPFVDKTVKGQQYARYYQHLRSLPGFGAAFSFVLSASSGFISETWRNENGTLTAIPGAVGARTDVATGPPPVPSS